MGKRRDKIYEWLRRAACLTSSALALSLLSYVGPKAMAQAPAPPSAVGGAAPSAIVLPYPTGMAMPFRTVGIDPEDVVAARPALDAAQAALAKSWLTDIQALTAYIGKQRPVTINAGRRVEAVQVGKPQGAAPGEGVALVVEPVWCSVMDRQLFFVNIADARRHIWLASRHLAVSRQGWDRLGAKAGDQATFLQTKLSALLRDALPAARARLSRAATDALQLGFSLGRESSRDDEGSGFCPTQLLAGQLAADYTVAAPMGGDLLATVRDLLGQSSELKRPTRVLVLRWTNPPEDEPRRQLPLTLGLEASVVEAVFGQHVAPGRRASVRVDDGPESTLRLGVEPPLAPLLQGEQASLKLAEWPQVAKVRGAWVYLDRGRAWGLQMNDRMLAAAGAVKGHVVRFFGPEAGLKSPRGWPIEEGAILYIRKGQKAAKVGMEFRFDPKTFPAPYPPPPATSAK